MVAASSARAGCGRGGRSLPRESRYGGGQDSAASTRESSPPAACRWLGRVRYGVGPRRGVHACRLGGCVLCGAGRGALLRRVDPRPNAPQCGTHALPRWPVHHSTRPHNPLTGLSPHSTRTEPIGLGARGKAGSAPLNLRVEPRGVKWVLGRTGWRLRAKLRYRPPSPLHFMLLAGTL